MNVRAGIRKKENSYIFDWLTDKDEDMVYLADNTFKQTNKDGIAICYGYEIRKDVPYTEKKKLRDSLKALDSSALFTTEVEDFVENGIFRIEQYKPLGHFKCIVKPEYEMPSLLAVLSNAFSEYVISSTFITVVKNMIENVRFNADRAYLELIECGYTKAEAEEEVNFTIKKFNDFKTFGKPFEIIRYISKELRIGFENYLIFSNTREKDAYEDLQGVEVLIIDDFTTSDSTLLEIKDLLMSVNRANTITAFSLIKS